MARKKEGGKARQKRRARERAKKTRKVTQPTTKPTPKTDPIFFSKLPKFTSNRVRDGPPGPTQKIRTGKVAQPKYERSIAVRPKGSNWGHFGTLIPISHFKPLVEKLKADGRLTLEKPEQAIEQLADITTKLIPIHENIQSQEYLDQVWEHGEHLTPLIAVKLGVGECREWTAIFTAMARAAGLDVDIHGHPEFYKHRIKGVSTQHVWPVVNLPSGEKVPVHKYRPITGIHDSHSRAEFKALDERVHSEEVPRYMEYKPQRPVKIPSELKVRRPDVFGE